jgi:hypothetical protein
MTNIFIALAVAVAVVSAQACNQRDISAAKTGGNCPVVAACVDGLKPTFDAACCAECKPPPPGNGTGLANGMANGNNVKEKCSPDMKAACAQGNACADGSKPKLINGTCCLDCYMAKKPKPVCTDDQKTSCKEKMPTLPLCTAEQSTGSPKDIFDVTACCAICKRGGSRGEANETKAAMKARCTPAIKDTCATTQPGCAPGGQPESDGLCCKTCKRANEGKSLNDLRSCAKPPKCADDEVSAQVDNAEGNPCASCRPGKPVCPK